MKLLIEAPMHGDTSGSGGGAGQGRGCRKGLSRCPFCNQDHKGDGGSPGWAGAWAGVEMGICEQEKHPKIGQASED